MPLSACIGVNPGEADQRQPLELDVEIELDPSVVFLSGDSPVGGDSSRDSPHGAPVGGGSPVSGGAPVGGEAFGSGGRRASLERSVDYGILAESLRRYVEADGRVFALLEDLVSDLFSLVSRTAPQARHIRVCIRKPQALGGAGIPMVLCDGPPDCSSGDPGA